MKKQDYKSCGIVEDFNYLGKLDSRIRNLRHRISQKENNKKFNIFRIFNRFGKNKKRKSQYKTLKEKIPKYYKAINSGIFKKNGYEFYLRWNVRFTKTVSEPAYYEVFVNITYSNNKKAKEFYKSIADYNDAKNYYSRLEGMLKLLKRSDIMERLFKEKLLEIQELSEQLNS